MIKPLLQKIVVAYHGSTSSLHAVMYGIMMAKLYKCQLKIVYVVDTASIKKLVFSKFMLSEEGERMTERLKADGERDMEYIVGLAKKKNVKVETEIREGAIWSQVITCADEYKANLILLGGTSSGASVSTLNHSNVTPQDSEIIGSAHCSVMVVHEPYIEQLFKLA